MATQLAEEFGGGDDAQTGGVDAPVDFKAEALRMGWVPLEEFKGDPKNHIDEETFYNRAVEYMPIAKATIKGLTRRLDLAERNAKQAADFFSKAEERAYTRALADIRAEQEAAVESGDIEAHRAAAAKLDKLEKPNATGKGAQNDEAQRAEEFADWMTENRWYSNDGPAALRIYADGQAEKMKKANNGILSLDDLQTIAEMTRAKYAAAYPEAFGGEAKLKPRNAVDGGGAAPTRRAGKTVSDLPDGGAQMKRFIKAGYVKDEAAYLKTYNW